MSTLRLVLGLLVVPACVDGMATSRVDQSIIGGTTAKPSDYPTVVELEGQPTEFECTGTLIDKDWVMVAAHCMEDLTAATGHIRLDGNHVTDAPTGTVIGIKSVHVDPQWTGATSWVWTHDLALIELAHSVTDRAPTPIDRDPVAVGTMTMTVGYGNSDNNNGGAGILRQLATPTMDCAQTSDANMKNANVLCFDGRDGTSSCYGDSGGPAFVTVGGVQMVAGATSGGTLQTEACTGPNAYYAYTAVHAELAFIDKYVPHANDGTPTDPTDPGTPSDPSDPTAPADPTAGSATPGDPVVGGCNAGGPPAGGLVILGTLVALARRRRRTA